MEKKQEWGNKAKDLLALAGIMAEAARRVVGGDSLLGRVRSASIYELPDRLRALLAAVDAYDAAVIAAAGEIKGENPIGKNIDDGGKK